MGNMIKTKAVWNRIAMYIVNFVEKCFYRLGVSVAINPWRTIGLSWLLVAICSLGLFKFYQEKHPLKLWVPLDSDFAKDTEWILERFSVGFRAQHLLVTAPNVLTPSILAELATINEKVMNIKAEVGEDQYTFSDICFKVPIINFPSMDRKRRSLDNGLNVTDSRLSLFDDDFFKEKVTQTPQTKLFDPSVDLDPEFYCGILNNLDMGCLQRSLLDIWKYNVTTISSLTEANIVDHLNKTTKSPVLGHFMEYASTLGGVKKDSEGKIISANSMLLVWLVHVNFTTVDMDKVGNQAGTEEWASEGALAWEQKFLNVMAKASLNISSDMNLYYEAGRSYGDISGETMFQDIDKLMLGIGMMFIYIQLILSKFNWVEAKMMLGSVGLMCVGMALIVATGICSLIGIPYGPVHTSLPFLLMGLGIDDMFVMKACWEHLTESERNLPFPDQIGLMLQHAGVSIVITTFTDIAAFLVGSITILPSLQSFCLYAAMGVLFIFLFSVTFYVAIFVLDIKRMKAKYNGVFPCIKHPNFTPTVHGHKSVFQQILFKFYSNVIFTVPVKVLVLLFTVIMTGFSVEALLRLEQKFDPAWFIPEGKYYSKFLEERKIYFPDMGYEASVFMGALNYSTELPKIYSLISQMQNETDIVQDLDAWAIPFKGYVMNNFQIDVENTLLTETEWRNYLSKFLFSPSGAKYVGKFRFGDRELQCRHPAPPVTVSTIDFTFKKFSGPKVYLPAMHRIKDLIRESNFTSGDKFASLWAKVFASWVTDEVIEVEVERNLELALVCVMACTIILIANFQMCFWIFICVLLTLVNVCGWMQRWGLTVDIVSCIGLELAIGLCVDYAAHVGHTFLTLPGTRQERALHTVTSIGAAVLYGGGSTLLSLSVLSTSEAYIFQSFFKIFFLVILFGLFNGIVFLPVVLSLIGPQGYRNDDSTIEKNRQINEKIDSKEELEIINLNEKS